MSSNEYATPLTLNIHPSRLATCTIFIVHVGAVMSVILVSINIYLKILISVLVLVSLWDVYNRVSLKKRNSITQIIWGTDNNWILKTSDGHTRDAQLLPSTYVHTWMTVLNFKKLNSMLNSRLNSRLNFNTKYFRSCSCVLLPDSMDAGELRRLRVRLTLVQYSLVE